MRRTILLTTTLIACFAHSAQAQTEDQKTTTPEVVVTGLDNPSGVAVQPITGTVFVANSAAGEIVRIVDGKAQPVITGFPSESRGNVPTFVFSPLTLAFISRDTLVVGGGGAMYHADLVRFYSVPAPGTSIKAAGKFRTLGPIKSQPGMSGRGGGNVRGVVVADSAVYVTSNGAKSQGGIARVKLADGKTVGKLTQFIATKKSVGAGIPDGITLTHNGHLLVAHRGETTKSKDSLISFYRNRDGQEMLTLDTGLHDITALAYSRATGRLYATDYAWNEPKSGGLYRLDRAFVDGRQVCKPTLIAKLDWPTALAFGKDGELYVTVFGTAQAGDTAKPGKLLKFAKGL